MIPSDMYVICLLRISIVNINPELFINSINDSEEYYSGVLLILIQHLHKIT